MIKYFIFKNNFKNRKLFIKILIIYNKIIYNLFHESNIDSGDNNGCNTSNNFPYAILPTHIPRRMSR